MKIIIALVLISLQPIAFADDKECEGTSGSTYVEGCLLGKSIAEMDKQLNIKYQRIIKMYKESNATEEIKLLVEAQRAWIRYRDKVCEFEDHVFGGANSISWVRCKARITETRLKEFNAFGNE
ncbi:MAG: lysozyme inhibitor LprI family protein [Methylobacter sp.]